VKTSNVGILLLFLGGSFVAQLKDTDFKRKQAEDIKVLREQLHSIKDQTQSIKDKQDLTQKTFSETSLGTKSTTVKKGAGGH